MSLYKYVKTIFMDGSEFDPASFTIGEVYEWLDGGFTDDEGRLHYMPHPDGGRDPVDGWDTSDYFEEVE